MTDSTDFLRQQLHTLRQTVGYLRERAAAVGGEVFLPPGDRHSLYQARAEIAGCKAELRARGVVVDDEPMDVAPPAAQGEPAQQPPPVPQVAATNSDSAGNQGMQGIVYGSVAIYNTAAGQDGPSRVFQLRAPVPDFVGRDVELERLVAALRPSQGSRAAAISGVRGMGGLGKTELAYAAAAQLAGDYPDGQILLELAGASTNPLSPAQALQQVIRAFRPEDKLPEELPALQKLYRSALGGRKVLMLADDARDAAQVRPLLPPTGCALLVTSRQRFILDGMIPIDLERLEEGAAVALLRGICDRLTDDQARQLAQRCGFLPLALRISAGILLNDPALSVERYLSRLADERQRLAHLKDPDDPTLDVRANLLLSYAALDEHMQGIFRRLGVLVAGADVVLIAAVLELSEDQADEVLRTLLRRSLVEYDPVHDRWGMHDLVRNCALGLLVQAGEERASRLYYAEQMIRLFKQIISRYRVDKELFDTLVLLQRQRAHLEAVGAWLRAQPPAPDIDALVISETGSAIFLGGLRESLQEVQLERVLVAARRQKDRAAEGRTLHSLGLVYIARDELRRGITFFKQHLAIVRELGDRSGEGMVLGKLGLTYHLLGEARRAIKLHEQHLAIVRELGNRLGEGVVLEDLGRACQESGDYARAYRLFEEQLHINRENSNTLGEAYALANLSTSFLMLRDATQARIHSEAALELAQDLGDRFLEGIALRDLANALVVLDQPDKADAYFTQSLTILEEIENQPELARIRWAYGQFLIQQGERERGLILLDACVAYEQQIGHAQAAEHAALVEQLRVDGAQPG